MRDVPFSGIYWLGYECLKKQAVCCGALNDNQHSTPFIAGAISGTVLIFTIIFSDILDSGYFNNAF
jgi:hypothetical protein